MAGQKNSKYSDEIAEKITGLIAAGVPKKHAARINGISYDCLNDWENGRGGIPKRSIDQFRQSIARAESQGVAQRVLRIGQAASAGDWRADAWYLEHVFPEEFGSPNRAAGGDDKSWQATAEKVADVAGLHPAEVAAMAKRLLDATKGTA